MSTYGQRYLDNYLRRIELLVIRGLLKLAVKIIEQVEDLNGGDMASYVTSYIHDLMRSSDINDENITRRRRHRKRSAFDSIGQRGGLNGFRTGHKRQKLEFTFENLLPFLMKEKKKRNRKT